MSQYLREYAANPGTTGDFATWSSNPANMSGVLNGALSNDSDLLSQSSTSMASSLAGAGNDRLQGMLNNERLMQTIDQDAKDALNAEVAARNAATPGSLAIPPSAQTQQNTVLQVQRQQLQATHEQTAATRGVETFDVGGASQSGYMPPSGAGFDAGSVTVVNGERIITSSDGATRWNITRGRYES
jgi:hypothetical protein